MLKPSVQVGLEDSVLVAEFWDCLRLDPAPVQDLRRHFETHVKQGGRPELIVDLNGVGYAGSAALGAFLAIHRFARQHDGRMVFCNVDAMVLEVFVVSKLDNLFSFAADKPAARALLAGASNDAAGSANPAAPAPRPARPASPSQGGGLRGRLKRDT